MTRRMVGVYALCCLTCGPTAAEEQDYQKAVAEARKANRLADVSRLCHDWAAAKPHDERPRLILGRTFRRAGMAERALEQFELAAEANPLSPAPRYETGVLFLDAKKPAAADKEFAEALRLDGTYPPARLGRIRVKLVRGDATGALADAMAQTENSGAHVLAGECLLALGKSDEAGTQFETALGLDSANADALFGLAKASQIDGKEAEAQQHWGRFLEAEPTGERARTVRSGWVVLKSDRYPVRGHAYPHWSPDGKRILFGYFQAYLMDLRDGSTTKLERSDGGKIHQYDWAPDGRRLVCRQGQIGSPYAIHELGAGGILERTDERDIDPASWMRFSPDGTKLLLSCVHGKTPRLRPGSMAVFDIASGEIRRIPWRHHRVSANTASWGPDGRTIVFSAYRGSAPKDRAIIAMRISNAWSKAFTVPRQLTDNGQDNLFPFISPNGRNVAYHTEREDGSSVVSIARLDGSTKPVTIAAGGRPHWSPDGRKLAYGSGRTIVVAHLGGLDPNVVDIAVGRQGRALSVVVTSQSETAQQVRLRWEAFDSNSFRIGHGEAEEGPLDVRPKEKVEWALKVAPRISNDAETIKISALNAGGQGAVKLVEWQE